MALADPAYVGALQALRLNGADLLPIPSDGDGLRVDVLADRLAAWGTAGARVRRQQLRQPRRRHAVRGAPLASTALADRYGFVIVDDDPYAELRWGGARAAPLASMSDRVIALGSTSKVLCPGLRVGWAVAPPEVARHLILLKQATDLPRRPSTSASSTGW